MAVIDQSVVRIGPDFTGFKTALRKGLKEATAGVTGKVKIELDLNRAALKASIRQATAGLRLPKLTLEVNKTALAASMRDAVRGANAPKIPLQVNKTVLTLSIREALATMRTPVLRVRVKLVRDPGGLPGGGGPGDDEVRDTRDRDRRVEEELRRSVRARRTIFDNLKPPTIVDWGGEGIKPMRLLIAAGVALAPVLIAVASSAVQASTSIVALGSAAYGGALAATGLITAFAGVIGALKLHASLQKAEQGQSVKAAATTRKLTIARAAEKKALVDTAQAYKDAAQKVRDLRLQLSDLRVQQSGNALDLEEAVRKQTEIHGDFFATDLMKRQADQAVLEARQKGKDIAAEIGKTKTDLTNRTKVGLAGSPEVVRAAGAIQALKPAAVAPLAGLGQLNAALKDLSPAARDLYNWLIANTEQFKAFKRGAEQAILPGFLSFLKDATRRGEDGTSAFSLFGDGVQGVGREISRTVARLGKLTREKWFKGDLVKLNRDNEKSFRNVGDAALIFLKPMMRLFVAASPLVVRFTGYLKSLAEKFADWIGSFSDKDLSGWFKRAGDELARWWGIATDLGSFLLSVFKASLPSGNNLVSRLKDLTASLADWAKSSAGQARIKAFFDFFKNIDYGKLFRVVGQVVTLTGLLRVGQFAAKNPLTTLLGLLAAKYPTETAQFLDSVAQTAITALTFVEKHTAAVADLLLILGAFKALKGVGQMKLSLGALFPGGGAPGTSIAKAMHVVGMPTAISLLERIAACSCAGGGTGEPLPIGPSGEPTPTPAPTPRPGGRGARWLSTLSKGVVVLTQVGTVAVGAGIVMEMMGQPFEWDPATDAKNGWASFKKTMEEEWNQDAGWVNKYLHGSQYPTFDNPDGGDKPTTRPPVYTPLGIKSALTKEGQAAIHSQGLERDAASTLNMWKFQEGPSRDKALQDWIAARKKSVLDYVAAVRSSQGPIAAEVALQQENERSQTSLQDVATKMGLGATETKKYATQIKAVPKVSKTDVKTPGMPEAATGFADLKVKQDKVTGKKTITVEVNGQTTVFDTLLEAMTYQRALQTGLTLPAAAQAIKRDEEATQYYKKKYRITKATGGMIPGFSPHPRADNIPTWLTAKEFVQPVDAVDYYGVDFMEAVRTKRFPRLADGGQPGKWPFKVDMSKTLIPQVGDTGGGQIIGDSALAEIAESTARAMGASQKQLIALIEAGIVESHMKNLRGGDQDSVGFLQQRPSQGWGSVKQIMDPVHATRKFIQKAMRVDEASYDAGQLAQAVQRSKYPRRYGAQYANAIAILNRTAPYVAGGAATPLGTTAGGRGWRWEVGVLNKAGFNFHPSHNQTTGGGHAPDSWHYRGRAVDLSPPTKSAFRWIESHYGATSKELFYTPMGYSIKNGRRVRPIDAAGHYNHIHWAYNKGGPVKKFDGGGILNPGVTMAVNNTRKPETVRTAEQEQALHTRRLDRRDLVLLAQYIASAVTGQTITMDGRKVAETVRGYDYLPKGI